MTEKEGYIINKAIEILRKSLKDIPSKEADILVAEAVGILQTL